MTSVFSYMENVKFELFIYENFMISIFQQLEIQQNEAKPTLIPIPYDKQSQKREEKTRENLFSHSKFSSLDEKAEQFLFLA